jgi:Methyltransferase small domain
LTGTLLNAAKTHSAPQSPTQHHSPHHSPHHSSSNHHSPDEVFFCPEESHFYSQCLEKMVFNHCSAADQVIEFGSGDGSPVIHSLLRTSFKGLVQGYELNPTACQVAQARIQQYRLEHQYVVHNQCFFEGWQQSSANYLIANPPYLPAPDNDICMPALHGGWDGAVITRSLFATGCRHILSLISAYSNPVETIEYALAQGYQVVDFMVSPLKFGYYSSESKVKDTIAALRQERKAFYSRDIYLLAGVLFKQQTQDESSSADLSADLSTELLHLMTAF